MDQVLAQPATSPDGWFWYALSILLALALIGIIWRYADRIQKTLDNVVKMVLLHERDIENIKDDIKEIKGIINNKH